MMTVKHITDTGEEFVYPTSHTNFVPGSAKPATGQPSSFWRYDHDGRAFEIDAGRVYVMNEHGTTVARYSLTQANNPAIGTALSIEASGNPALV